MFFRTYCVHASILGAAALFIQSFSPAQATPSRECDGPRLESVFDAAQHRVLEVPAKGWLLVEVGASDDSPTWFDIALGSCAAASPLVAVERGLEEGLLEVEPGRLELRYGTVDPGLGTPVRLSTHFVPEHAPQPRDGEEGDDTETGDGEIVPKDGGGPGSPNGPNKDGEEGDDTETGDGEIVPTRGSLDTPWWGCLAGEEPFDDFGLCATWIAPGQVLQQQLGEFRGDDRDHFAFELEVSARVRISHRSTVPMKGTLLLADGRPLVTARDPSLSGLDLEADLVAGVYLLRFEGIGESPGTYELSLATSRSGSTF